MKQRIDGIGYSHKGTLATRFLNHSASQPAISKAINSISIADFAMYVCLEDFQDTDAPVKVNTKPLVECISSLSEIQLASQYPSKIGG